MNNPLFMAVDAAECLMEMESDMMFAVGGDAVFEPFDDELNSAAIDLVYSSSSAVEKLSHRARHARLNLIWKDFVKEQKQKRTLSTLDDINARLSEIVTEQK